MFLCSFQVELTGLNTVLVQNLSSLSTYLVSVQSRYPQGLSAAIVGNITTCNSSTTTVDSLHPPSHTLSSGPLLVNP